MARPSVRNRQVVRQWELLNAIAEQPSTLEELATALDVTDRTIRRDLDALEAVYFPIVVDEARRWRLINRQSVPQRTGGAR